MAEVASSVNINDIPEELKGYRKALLNAAFGQVFTPDYLRMQIPTAEFPNAAAPTQPSTQPPPVGQAQNPEALQNAYITQIAGMGDIGDSAGSVEEMLSHRVQYASGGLAKAAEMIEKMLAGDVNLGASGTPLGAYTAPMVVSPPANIPYTISTGTRQPPAPTPPTVTPPATSGPTGVITTPPTGTLPVGNPNPTAPPSPVGTGITPTPVTGGPNPNPGGIPSQLIPGRPAPSQAPAMFSANKPANFAGADQAASGGYNPAQYADESVAQDLARQMGGNVVYTNTVGANAPPSQAMINAGGSEMHNAGLIADINKRFADDEGMRKFALENLRQEIRSYGGDTGGFAQGGIVKMAEGGAVNPFALPRVQTSPTSALGMGTASTQTTAPPGMSAGAFNPYQSYGGQRILGMGNQGQVDQNGFLQASDLTRNAISGYGNMPSYFNANGTIAENRNANGEATTPLGIAGDTFQSAGQLALDASMRAGNSSYASPLQSTFGTTLAKIADNPSMFQAGDISLGQLTAPQLDSPIGVGTSQLTSYQMAGPRLVDTSGSNINPSYIQGQNLRQYQADQPQNIQGEQYGGATIGGMNNVSGQQYNASTIGGAPQVDVNQILRTMQGTRMDGVKDVTGGQIGVGRFTDPGTRDAYMSPYMQAVVDVQRDQANRDFRESSANRSAAAIKAGAFGGNRQAVADSLAERDRANLLNQIQATGSQAAFENAQQQYERDRGASMAGQQFNVNSRLQGDLANQQAGLTVGGKNLDAALQTNNLLSNLGLQGQLANQQAGLTVSQANQGALNQAGQYNAGNRQQADLANQGMNFNVAQANQGALNQAGQFNAANRQQANLANQGSNQAMSLANLQALLGTQQLGATLGQQANLANQGAYMDAATKNQGTNLQAQMANQSAMQQANQANLGAALGVQELGANQYMQSQLANQNAGLTAGQANQNAALQTQALARNSGLTAAQANQNTRLSQNTTLLDALSKADQLQQQAAQGNFSNQLNAMGQQTNSALAANTIGQSRADLGRLAQAQELLRLQSMGQAGAGIDTRTQGALDLGYQDWTNQMNYPYQQMNWLQSMLSGTPMGYNQEGVQFQKTNPLSQIAGLGTAALGAYRTSQGG